MVPESAPRCSGCLSGRPLEGQAGLLQAAPADLAGPFRELPGALIGFDEGELLFHATRMAGGYDSHEGAASRYARSARLCLELQDRAGCDDSVSKW